MPSYWFQCRWSQPVIRVISKSSFYLQPYWTQCEEAANNKRDKKNTCTRICLQSITEHFILSDSHIALFIGVCVCVRVQVKRIRNKTKRRTSTIRSPLLASAFIITSNFISLLSTSAMSNDFLCCTFTASPIAAVVVAVLCKAPDSKSFIAKSILAFAFSLYSPFFCCSCTALTQSLTNSLTRFFYFILYCIRWNSIAILFWIVFYTFCYSVHLFTKQISWKWSRVQNTFTAHLLEFDFISINFCLIFVVFCFFHWISLFN